MTKENRKGMKDLNALNVYRLELHTKVTLSKSCSETITMPMICSLIEHGFLPVFSIEGKVMLYSNQIYKVQKYKVRTHETPHTTGHIWKLLYNY